MFLKSLKNYLLDSNSNVKIYFFIATSFNILNFDYVNL